MTNALKTFVIGFGRYWPLFLPALSTPLLLALCLGIGEAYFGLRYASHGAWRDLWLQLAGAYAFVLLSRRPLPFLLLQFIFMAFLFFGNAAKTAFHGVPLTVDDIYAADELFGVLHVGQKAVVLGVAIAFVVLFLGNLKFRRTAVVAVLAGAGTVLSPEGTALRMARVLDGLYWHSVWDHRGNLVSRGVSLHTLMEATRYLAANRPAPGHDAVADALAGLSGGWQPADRVSTGPPGRNVHMILLESFWDPSVLSKAGFNRRPLDPRFDRLWKAAGSSSALVPVFGGYTANAEFESLCAFPVSEEGVKFERRLRNDVPCLPRFLSGLGYTTLVSHPNVAGFWNRTNAYRRIGFQTYWSIDHFETDDMNLDFLADASLYRQVAARIKPLLDSGDPVFNYVVTYFGHWDYPLNDQRPAVIRSRSQVPEVPSFANTVYYKSKELMDYIKTLQVLDPEGIIVAFGDHLPFLGENFGGYAESGLLTEHFSDFTPEMFWLSHQTPLLIIDGRRGPVPVGELPLYRLPGVILALLGIEDKGILDLAAGAADWTLRPLPDLLLAKDGQGRLQLCLTQTQTGPCRTPMQWLAWVSVLGDDLFAGRQSSIKSPLRPISPPTHNILLTNTP